MAQPGGVARARYQNLNYAIGSTASAENSIRPVASRFRVKKGHVQYYKDKFEQPGLHCGTHGGARHFKFDPTTRILAETTLLTLVGLNGRPRPDGKYASQMQELGYDVNRKWVGRTFNQWKFNKRKMIYKFVLKYTKSNVRAMAAYVEWALQTDMGRMVFLDEAIFRSKELLPKQQRAAADSNEHGLLESKVSSETYTITLLTTLRSDTGYHIATPRAGINTAIDFLQDIIEFIDRGALRRGDILVIDNAPTHVAKDVFPIVVALLEHFGIDLIRLPKYCPEYNPCEMVWAQVKRYLRDDRDYARHSFLHEILAGFAKVSYGNIVNYYRECVPGAAD